MSNHAHLIIQPVNAAAISAQIQHALKEDIGTGDITSALISSEQISSATLTTREQAVFCGKEWFETVFRKLDKFISIAWNVADGDVIKPQQILCTIRGQTRMILTAERTAINFVQTLSATATLARLYADKAAPFHTTILDTRKTIPGLRLAQKYAVMVGGCTNHRIGLYDAFLIKENHIAGIGSISQAVAMARESAPHKFLEIEIESISQLPEALAAHPERILLDNFTLADIHTAVAHSSAYHQQNPDNPKVCLEGSGNISLTTLDDYLQTGIDYLSIGEITKNIAAVDLSLSLH